MKRIGVVDTMFARANMGAFVLETLEAKPDHGTSFICTRATVPGFKDLAVAAKTLIQAQGCELVVACAMPGGADLDRLCAHEASLGIMAAQLMASRPILEVFVHESEAGGDDDALLALCAERCAKHALNAYDMVFAPETLVARAGAGVRQGQPDAGPIIAARASSFARERV
jgi:riboflavin synthase